MPMPRELVTRLEAKIDGLTESVSDLRAIMARMEATQEQSRLAASASVIRADGHEARLTVIEAWKNRAEGAAWAGKLLWALVIAAVGGFAEWLIHRKP